jgi:hypothetical protein
MNWRTLLWHLSLALLVTTPAVCTLWIFYHSYETFTAQVFGSYQQPDKLEKFRAALLTPERFTLLRICTGLLTGICLLLCIFFWNRYQLVSALWLSVKSYLLQKWVQVRVFQQGLSDAESYTVLFLFAAVLISRLYFLFRVPFHIDERFTYLYFVSKGLGVSMAYYPNPNNHLFFTLICNLAAFFTDNPWLVMKLPALLLGFVLVVVYWAIVRSYFGAIVAILATVLFAFNGSVWYYGLQGRGYSLLMICLLIAIRSLFSILENKEIPLSSFIWLWLSSVLGFYTIPVFIYPFAGMMLFGSLYSISHTHYFAFRNLCLCAIITAISTFILYLPVFVFNGWNAISGNGWVVPMPWNDFLNEIPAHLLSMAENMWGYFPSGQWWLLLIIVYSVGVLIRKTHASITRKWLALFLTCLLTLLMISVAQRVLLFQRLILYLSIFQYLILALIMMDLLSLLSRKHMYTHFLLTGVCILYIVFNALQFYKDTAPDRFDLYDSFDNISSLLYEKQADGIFVNMYEYALCIRFQYETNGRAIQLDSQQINPGNAYHYLVLHKEYSIPPQISLSQYKIIYSDAEAVVYERISQSSAF